MIERRASTDFATFWGLAGIPGQPYNAGPQFPPPPQTFALLLMLRSLVALRLLSLGLLITALFLAVVRENGSWRMSRVT